MMYNKILSMGLFEKKDIMQIHSQYIKYANIITNVLDCDKLNCPEPSSFSSKNGVSKNKVEGDKKTPKGHFDLDHLYHLLS